MTGAPGVPMAMVGVRAVSDEPGRDPGLDSEGNACEQHERRDELFGGAAFGVADEPIDEGLLQAAPLHVVVEHEVVAHRVFNSVS